MKKKESRRDIFRYEVKENDIGGFEFCSIEEVHHVYREKAKFPVRTGVYQILVCFTKVENHQIDFNHIPIEPFDVFFVRKDKIHIFDQSAEYRGMMINFTEEFICRDEHDLALLQQHPLFNTPGEVGHIRPDDITPFQRITDAMQTELNKPRDVYTIIFIRNMLQNLLILSLREYKRKDEVEVVTSGDASYVQRYLKLVEKNFITVRSVAAYAAMMKITEKRLNQATTNIIGKSPKKAIDDQVLIEAKRLLTFTMQSVKEAGFSLGFTQTTHFIKYFQKHVGVTPSVFRQQQSYKHPKG